VALLQEQTFDLLMADLFSSSSSRFTVSSIRCNNLMKNSMSTDLLDVPTRTSASRCHPSTRAVPLHCYIGLLLVHLTWCRGVGLCYGPIQLLISLDSKALAGHEARSSPRCRHTSLGSRLSFRFALISLVHFTERNDTQNFYFGSRAQSLQKNL
jgi:hypothetical protein